MGRGIRYTEEFKREAVNQVVVHGYPALEVSQRLGVTNKSVNDRIKKYYMRKANRTEDEDLRAEVARLKRKLNELSRNVP